MASRTSSQCGSDVLNEIEYQIELAVSESYDMSTNFCLESSGGRYVAHSKTCHPLETVVLGSFINGPINYDIAAVLGVSIYWVDGFADGYAGSKPDQRYGSLNPADPYRRKYEWGFACGDKIQKYVLDMEAMAGLSPS